MSTLSVFFIYSSQFNPSNVEADWQPSFFNLQIELLLEGLFEEGVPAGEPLCEVYKFHVERGYGATYFNQVTIIMAKMSAFGLKR